MKARVAGIAGSVLALTVIGGFAAASTFQPAPVRVVQPAAVTPAPTVAPVKTVAPVVKAAVPVASKAPAPVRKAATVPAKPAAAEPAPRATVSAPRPAGTYPDGSPFVYDATGRLLEPDVAPAPGYLGNAPQSDGHGVPIPRPTP